MGSERWDIFCSVVDNYGDIGITWRLARQLTHEYGIAVRLWVDDLESFRRIRPEIRPEQDTQALSGVEVRRWRTPFPEAEPGAVVIEALACHLPAEFEQAMAACAVEPVWINLEYLSAEDWVVGCHGLPSPHPRLPLTKWFFMPGYTAGTGGVLRERTLPEERDAFQTSATAQDAFWHTVGLPGRQRQEIRISLFSYENRSIHGLFSAWAESGTAIRCLAPAGKSLSDIGRFFGRAEPAPGAELVRGSLTVHVLPMLDQKGYDRLLWACDCNFVRGEDSFVRAQWAGRPLVWQAYRQEETAHLAKLGAFMDRYGSDLAADDALALRRLWQAWNEEGEAGEAWPAFWARRELWLERSAVWQAGLEKVGDLAGNLIKFCNEKSSQRS